MKHIMYFINIIFFLSSQILIFSNSVFKISDISLRQVPSIKTLVSSANKILKSSSDDQVKLFM